MERKITTYYKLSEKELAAALEDKQEIQGEDTSEIAENRSVDEPDKYKTQKVIVLIAIGCVVAALFIFFKLNSELPGITY